MTYFLKCVLIEDYHISETGSSKWNNCLNFLPEESLPGKKNIETSQEGRCFNLYFIIATKNVFWYFSNIFFFLCCFLWSLSHLLTLWSHNPMEFLVHLVPYN